MINIPTRRRYLVLVVTILLIAAGLAAILISDKTSGPWKAYTEPARARLVLVNGFAVAHPDYQIAFNELQNDQFKISPSGGRLLMAVSPRSPYLDATFQSYRQELSIDLLATGDVSVQRLAVTTASRALARLGQPSGDRIANSDPDILKGLGRDVRATVLVKLKRPESESVAHNIWPGRFDRVILDMGGKDGSIPVSWPSSACNSKGFIDCADGATEAPLILQFRKWLSFLDGGDGVALGRLGVDLDRLHRAAEIGMVYGYIATGDSSDLASLSKDPTIERVEVLDIFLNI